MNLLLNNLPCLTELIQPEKTLFAVHSKSNSKKDSEIKYCEKPVTFLLLRETKLLQFTVSFMDCATVINYHSYKTKRGNKKS